MNSSSGTIPDTTSVSDHRIQIQIQKSSGTRPETGSGYGFQVPLRENIRNSPDPAGFCRTSLTWGEELSKINNKIDGLKQILNKYKEGK